jgi:hypothetical protein
MAVYMPIISEFNAKGINRAKREFKSLDGVAAKTGFILKKSFLPALGAVGALAGGIMAAVDAALEDQQSQAELARVMKATLKVTDDQIAANEKWISSQIKLTGVSDDEMRPALAKILRVTKDITKAQSTLTLAMNISRGTGKDLASVTDALSRAMGGNMKSLKALAPELGGLIKDGASAEEVFARLNETFGTATAEYAKTTAGRIQILKERFGELVEEVGYAFLPILEQKLLPKLEEFATWLEQNPEKIEEWVRNFAKLAEDIVKIADALAKIVGFVTDERGRQNVQRMIEEGKAEIIRPRVEEFRRSSPFQGQAGFRASTMGTNIPSNLREISSMTRNITVNVNGGDPKAVVDAIVRWSRQNGRLPPAVRTAQ